jgi:hypothetical protein
MTITLSDIASATSSYIESEVDVRVGGVTRNVQDGNDGKYTVRVTNASAPTGVRLRDIVLHLTSSDDDVLTLFPPGSAILTPRATNDATAPRLPSGTPVAEMFIFLVDGDNLEPNSTLDVGEQFELELDYHGEGPGTATLDAHIHATVEVDDLFPRTDGAHTAKEIEIRP